MATTSEQTKLLFGPYRTPRLKRGDRAFCLYRNAPVAVIGLSAARIPWPVCLPVDPPRRGRGLVVDEELARAVRHESCLAVAYWWGVNRSTVHKWRRALGVTRTNNQGTHRLVLNAISATLASRFGATRGSRTRANQVITSRGRAAVWTPEEIALLGALPDKEVAEKTGRSLGAVNKRRSALRRPALAEGARGTRRVFWTVAEDSAIRTLPPEEVTRRFKRSLSAIEHRKRQLRAARRRAR